MSEQTYTNTLPPEAMERESALEVYIMVRGFLHHNSLLLQGEQPTDDDGKPLFVTFKTEEVVAEIVRRAFGSGQRIQDAVDKAYANHYAELLQKEE